MIFENTFRLMDCLASLILEALGCISRNSGLIGEAIGCLLVGILFFILVIVGPWLVC